MLTHCSPFRLSSSFQITQPTFVLQLTWKQQHALLCDVTPCCLVEIYHRYRETHWLQYHNHHNHHHRYLNQQRRRRWPILMMDAASSETSEYLHQPEKCHIQEDSSPHSLRCDNLKCHPSTELDLQEINTTAETYVQSQSTWLDDFLLNSTNTNHCN